MIGPILLILASFLVLVLEVFFVSFGLLTLVALTLAVVGVLLGFEESVAFGWTLIALLVVGGPAAIWGAFKVLPRLPFGRRFQLQPPTVSEQERRAAATSAAVAVGAVGEATSPLRPAGTALFDGRPVSVVTTGRMLPRGTPVKVVAVSGNRVVVERAG